MQTKVIKGTNPHPLIISKRAVWLLSLLSFCLSPPPIACATHPYTIARIVAISYDQPILSSELSNPSLTAITHQGSLSPIQHLCLTRLLEQYATTLSPYPLNKAALNQRVENQIRQWHQQGMTQEALQTSLGVDNIQEVRKKVQERYTKALAYNTFIHHAIEHGEPTPTEVQRFYKLHLASPPRQMPAKVVLLQVAYYPPPPAQRQALALLEHLYHKLNATKDVHQRAEALLKHIRNHSSSTPYPSHYAYLSSRAHTHELLIEEIPPATQKAIRQSGHQALTPGMIIPAHPFVNPYGLQGIRIIFVESCIPPHTLNLNEDYTYIRTLYLQSARDNRIIQWWRLHHRETDIYDSPGSIA